MTRRPGLLGAAVLYAVAVLSGSAAAQVGNWPTERPPRPLPARDVRFPPYVMKSLPNGLQVIAVSHHEQPAVSLRLLIRAGGAQDPQGKPGVASLFSSVLDQGTTTRSAEQIAHAIDSIGGVLGTGSGTDLTTISAIVMKDSLNLGLDLVSDIARNPAFSPQEVELQRKQMLSGLQVSYDDPEYLATVVFERLVYGFHPYGSPDAGTPQSIAAITRDDLVAFHKSWFGANNAILAVVGDVTADEAFAGAERVFGSWGKSTKTAEKPVAPPAPTRRLVLIDRPGAVQTEIRAGHTALPRNHPDYLALDLAVKILGGEGGNRLHRVLRSERGLTYGASADLKAFTYAGNIVADTDTRSESTGEVLRLLVDEMARLQRQRVSERELADAQAYLTGSFPLTIETPDAIALQVLNAVVYGLDLQELQTFRERVNAVSVDDIQRVAKTYLHPERLSIVLVGDANKFEKQLLAIGFPEYERIPVNELDLGAVELRKKAAVGGRLRPAGLFTQAGRESDRSRDLIDLAVRGKGGAEKLRSIQTVQALSDMTIETPQGPVKVPTTLRVRYPAQFRMDTEMPIGPLVQVFDSGSSWVKDGRGVRVLSEAAAESMRQNVIRDHIPLLLALNDGRLRARRSADVSVDGRSMPTLVIDFRTSGPLTLILDANTGLILRQRYGARRAAEEIEEIMGDYRDVNGLQVAYTVTIHHPGEPTITRVLRSFEYNVPLDPSVFARPSS